MVRALKVPAVPVPVRVGQTRSDKQGGTIIVTGPAPIERYAVEYPALDGEIHILGAETIEQLYPVIVSEPR